MRSGCCWPGGSSIAWARGSGLPSPSSCGASRRWPMPRRRDTVRVWLVLLGVFGLAYAPSVAGFIAARFALGLGEAGNFPAAIRTVAEWFPVKERAFATGSSTRAPTSARSSRRSSFRGSPSPTAGTGRSSSPAPSGSRGLRCGCRCSATRRPSPRRRRRSWPIFKAIRRHRLSACHCAPSFRIGRPGRLRSGNS